MKHLKLEKKEQIAVLTLCNLPQNRMGNQMQTDFEEAIQILRDDRDVRALIIRADGDIFSYGGNFPEWIGLELYQIRAIIERWIVVINQIERLPYPVIAAINGPCWGGGFEFALACDIVLASPNASFNHPEKTLAITTILGGIYRFAERAGKNIAAELAYTSKPIDAERMYQLGVVNRIVERDKLDEEAMKLARELAEGPAAAHEAHKTLLRLWSQSGKAAADEALLDLSIALFETEDVKNALLSAKEALEKGVPRSALKFKGQSCFR